VYPSPKSVVQGRTLQYNGTLPDRYKGSLSNMQDCKEFRLEIGDTELSVIEWAGTGDPILLLHATGFHSRCWNEVVRCLPGRHIYAVDLRFHGASGDTGPINWHVLSEDIQALVERLDLTHLIGVGHSIGGYLIARAAAHAPQRFKHLVLVDPVICSAERYAEILKIPEHVTPQDLPVSRRKNDWQDSDEMYERFKEREPFNAWQPAVLRDYCNHALRPAQDGEMRRLACDPLSEAGIYLNQKGNEVILRELPSITAPVTLLRAPSGNSSLADLSGSPTWPDLASAFPNCEEVFLPGLNHFMPMQDPALVAGYIQAAQ
jgi:pimeloyl-ACP methyl ester carboxylesterase